MKEIEKRVLAYKIGTICSNTDCSRMSAYQIKGECYCESCFKQLEEELLEENMEVIFPSYQEPQFPRVKSNMLVTVLSTRISFKRTWGKTLGKQSSTRSKKKRRIAPSTKSKSIKMQKAL